MYFFPDPKSSSSFLHSSREGARALMRWRRKKTEELFCSCVEVQVSPSLLHFIKVSPVDYDFEPSTSSRRILCFFRKHFEGIYVFLKVGLTENIHQQTSPGVFSLTNGALFRSPLGPRRFCPARHASSLCPVSREGVLVDSWAI